MYDELLDLYDNYVTNHKYADNTFVNQVFIIINKYHSLGKYLKEVYVTNGCSEYLPIDQVINIGLNEINQLIKGLKDQLQDDYVYLYNLFVIETIFHELEHVYQEEKKDSEEDIESFLLLLSDPIILTLDFVEHENIINHIKLKLRAHRQKKYYEKNHDLAPQERIANLRSSSKTIDLINNHSNPNKGIAAYHLITNDIINKLLVKGYHLNGDKTNSPSLDYLKGMRGTDNKRLVNFIGFHDLSISYANRLLYGLELTSDEYSDLLNVIKARNENTRRIL